MVFLCFYFNVTKQDDSLLQAYQPVYYKLCQTLLQNSAYFTNPVNRIVSATSVLHLRILTRK